MASVIKSWGLINASNSSVPHPTAVIVDAGGKIRYFRQDMDYRRRPSAKKLLKALAEIE